MTELAGFKAVLANKTSAAENHSVISDSVDSGTSGKTFATDNAKSAENHSVTFDSVNSGTSGKQTLVTDNPKSVAENHSVNTDSVDSGTSGETSATDNAKSAAENHSVISYSVDSGTSGKTFATDNAKSGSFMQMLNSTPKEPDFIAVYREHLDYQEVESFPAQVRRLEHQVCELQTENAINKSLIDSMQLEIQTLEQERDSLRARVYVLEQSKPRASTSPGDVSDLAKQLLGHFASQANRNTNNREAAENHSVISDSVDSGTSGKTLATDNAKSAVENHSVNSESVDSGTSGKQTSVTDNAKLAAENHSVNSDSVDSGISGNTLATDNAKSAAENHSVISDSVDSSGKTLATDNAKSVSGEEQTPPNDKIQLIVSKTDPTRYRHILINKKRINYLYITAQGKEGPLKYLVNGLLDEIFTRDELCLATGLGSKKDSKKSGLDKERVDAIEEYVKAFARKHNFEMLKYPIFTKIVRQKLCNARKSKKKEGNK